MSEYTIRPTVLFKRLPHGLDIAVPEYMTIGAAGADIHAAVLSEVTLLPGSRAIIPSGFALSLPEGYEGQVRSRSGLAIKNGIMVLNSPGTIDSDYTGEVGVILANLGTVPFVIKRGDRVAQLVITPVVQAVFEEVQGLTDSVRGIGGFGSTGFQMKTTSEKSDRL